MPNVAILFSRLKTISLDQGETKQMILIILFNEVKQAAFVEGLRKTGTNVRISTRD